MWLVFGVLIWGGLVALARWFEMVPLRGRDDFQMQWMYRIADVAARWLHRLRIEGAEHVPTAAEARETPLIVVANHTAGIDPVLVQIGCPFEIRWMMAADMRAGALEWAWSYLRVIFVDREKQDGQSVREALRHLKQGGVLGLFPEGHLERPPRHVLPFKDGIGLMVRKSGARVLIALIDGTPQVDPAWGSLLLRSESSVRFLPVVEYGREMSAKEITADLEQWVRRATGWARSPYPAQVEDGRLYCFGLDGRYHDAADWEAKVDEGLQAKLMRGDQGETSSRMS